MNNLNIQTPTKTVSISLAGPDMSITVNPASLDEAPNIANLQWSETLLDGETVTLSEAMKTKLAMKRKQGRGGWDDKQACPPGRLQGMLIEHLQKGDPVDIGNFAMMIWSRGESVTSPGSEFDLVEHLHRQRTFSEKTFGPGARANGVLNHIESEIGEVRANPTDVSEWIDIILLAFDGAWRTGHSPEEIVAALEAKQTKNESRTWPDWRQASPDKAIEHVDSNQHALIGRVVRYGSGSTALFRVAAARNTGAGFRLSGDHILGGTLSRHECRVSPATEEDLQLWAQEKGLTQRPQPRGQEGE